MFTKKVIVMMSVEGQDLGAPVAHAPVKAMVVIAAHEQEAAQRGRKTKAKEQSLVAFHETRTDENGEVILSLEPGKTYEITATGLGGDASRTIPIEDEDDYAGSDPDPLVLVLNRAISLRGYQEGNTEIEDFCTAGDVIRLEAQITPGENAQQSEPVYSYSWLLSGGALLELPQNQNQNQVHWDTANTSGHQTAHVTITDSDGTSVAHFLDLNIREAVLISQLRKAGSIPVSLRRGAVPETEDKALGEMIRNRTKAIAFSGKGYKAFIDRVIFGRDFETTALARSQRFHPKLARLSNEIYSPVHGMGLYELIKTATEIFLLAEAGVVIEEFSRFTHKPLYDVDAASARFGRFVSLDEMKEILKSYLGDTRLPYIQRVIDTAFECCDHEGEKGIICCGLLAENANRPLMIELIWNYWHEEAMLAQTMKAISLRFQNRRRSAGPDPLANLEIAPLFAINNLLWGYIQDEQHRVGVAQRAHEYAHEYGIMLTGKAVSDLRPADSRSKFLEAFHNLLHLSVQFFKQDDDVTINADAFPILNALREVHLILAHGLHNQAHDLPWQSRAEMLLEQYILSRPELREFLQSRAMVPYREEWMPAVDAMKRLQGWNDVSVNHFNELAVFGEQILLAIRYGDWIGVNDPAQAANWARDWRPEIQNYIHSYWAVTGVDLRADMTTTQQRALISAQPSMLLRHRLSAPASVPALPEGTQAVSGLPTFRVRRDARRQS